MPELDPLERRAREAIDAVRASEPAGPDPGASEAAYAERLEAWVCRLVPAASLALRLAARAQHLERWAIPRGEYPRNRGGYLRWRSAVHARQGDRVREILDGIGIPDGVVARVADLVSKRIPVADPEAAALEDAACLVFLETQLAGFSEQHERAKVLDVLRKTWRKMSPAGREAAATLDVPPPLQALLREATSG